MFCTTLVFTCTADVTCFTLTGTLLFYFCFKHMGICLQIMVLLLLNEGNDAVICLLLETCPRMQSK